MSQALQSHALWLWMAERRDQWFGAADVLHNPEIPEQVEDVLNVFYGLHKHACLVRRGTHGRYQYRVDDTCILPRGLTLGRVRALLLGEREEV